LRQQQQCYPGIDTDNDNMIDIDNELIPFASWYQSHKHIQPTIEIIENLGTQNILILQGEKDIQTNIEQALLLEQKLTELYQLSLVNLLPTAFPLFLRYLQVLFYNKA
jgi:hypothetical protein